jgi:hypothetical protein
MAIPINPISPQYQDNGVLSGLVDEDNSDWLTVKWADEEDEQGRGDPS